MRTGKVVEYVYVKKSNEEIYSVARVATPTSNVFYNVHRLDVNSLEWRFVRQIEVLNIQDKTLRKKFIDIIGWNILYNIDIPEYVGKEQIKKMKNLFLDKIFAGEIEDGRWRSGQWPQSRKQVGQGI